LCGDLKRHFDNDGRHYYSVAESSWDTWLDGYVPGVPGRKVSIYMEGLVAALIADSILLEQSKGRYRLDDVLQELYQQGYKHGKGYTENSYRALLEKYSGISFESYFREVIWGKGQMEKWLREALTRIGYMLEAGKTESSGYQINLLPTGGEGPLFSAWSGLGTNK
jgi:predicted metalloprotease with PDZ domain